MINRILLATFLLAPLAIAEPGDEALKQARKSWRKLDRPGKLDALTRLGAFPSDRLLQQCKTWLSDPDAVVQGQVVRLIGSHVSDGRHWRRIESILVAHVNKHLGVLEKRAKKEFVRVCRKHGAKVPPGDQMAAGADWEDPYDEDRRPLPPEVRAERAHMFEVLSALEPIRTAGHVDVALAIFRRHHDPEVLVRAIGMFGRWKEWRALVPMADLQRIQENGRMMGGADVIGKELYTTRRLKWDVHKDRLWWSRPEYVPRIRHYVYDAATAITGERIGSAAGLDAWLLANEPKLRAHRVKLSAAFKARARSSQR